MEGKGTHTQPQNECIALSDSLSRSFIARAATCSTVVWFVLMSTKCDMSIAQVNTANRPDLAVCVSARCAQKKERSRTHRTITTMCCGSTVVSVREAARALSPTRVESVQRQKNRDHTTNTKKN